MTSTSPNSTRSRRTFRSPPGTRAPAPPKNTVHRGSGKPSCLKRSFLLRAGADRVLVPVEEHVQVRMLTLDLLDLLHDVLEGNRLVVRVDPEMDLLLHRRPQGPRREGFYSRRRILPSL